MDGISRRSFLGGVGVLGAGAAFPVPTIARGVKDPIAVSSANGVGAVETACTRMAAGADPLVAAVAGVNLVELDPNDMSVGYGGLPNERGVVQLDAAVMHGPTHRGGAVAALEGCKTPSRVALKVLERTDHCLLVGAGARDFADAHGFPREELLTDRARKVWLRWKEGLSDKDDWLSPEESGGKSVELEYGTIHLSARDAGGRLGCVTTTSGLSFKIPGRVGDSPIIGAGLFLDQSAGSAGSTGRGEAVILSAGSASIVDEMRRGATPTDACVEICRRIRTQARRDPTLVNEAGRPNFNVNFYAIGTDGSHGGAALKGPFRYAVCDAEGARLVDGAIA